MFDRVLDEIVRAKEAPQPQHLRRWQQHIQTVVLPALARLAALDAEIADQPDEGPLRPRRRVS